MFQNRYLARWQEANLLDVGQVQRIQAWEAANARPVGLWAISGLGVFSVVLGILAIIGANWEAIPPSFKLGFVLALTSLVAVALFIAALRGLAWPRELLALLLFGLVIGGIALISQIYQLGGQVWTALLVWVLVCTPFLVLATRSSMAALAWAGAVTATWIAAWQSASALLRTTLDIRHDVAFALSFWLLGAFLAICGQLRSIWQPTANQARWLVGLSAIAITTAIFIAHIVPGFIGYHRGTNTLSGLAILVSAGAMAGPIALALWHRQNAWAIFLAAAWLVWLLPLGIRIGPILVEGGRGGIAANNFVAGVGFIIFWSFTGWLALRAGQRGLFALAFTFAAGRVLVLYFEAFGGLSATGFGLIGGGLLLLGLSWVGWKLSRITSPTGSTPGAAP